MKPTFYMRRMMYLGGVIIIMTIFGYHLCVSHAKKLLGRLPDAQWKKKTASYRSELEKYGAKRVVFHTHDALELSALWIQRSSSRVILMCHGYRMSKELMTDYIQLFPEDSILILDFRGHGESAGQRTTLGVDEKRDVEAALAFIHDQIAADARIVGFGHSMGCLPLLKIATDEQHAPYFDALILDSGFASLKKVVAERYGRYAGFYIRYALDLVVPYVLKWLVRIDASQAEAVSFIKTIAMPVLLVHLLEDKVIDVAHAKELFQSLCSEKDFFMKVDGKINIVDKIDHAGLYSDGSGAKQLWLVQGRNDRYTTINHGEIIKFVTDEYIQNVANFLKK